MRLLTWNSHNELQLTDDLIDNIPPYAILSHTWGSVSDEVAFDDIKHGQWLAKAGYAKIRFCGEQARKDKINYFWVDTCCINKNNHVELAEAITSMFRSYRDAEKCYAYLADVQVGGEDVQNAWQPSFRKSRWFTRGWTLQELLAPTVVEFFSGDEHFLGTKATLALLIHEITTVPLAALLGRSLTEFPITERLRWTQNRQTTKREDMAYCLLGMFDVYMSLNYGEGDNAFLRLKRKIDKKFGGNGPDHAGGIDEATSKPQKRLKMSHDTESLEQRSGHSYRNISINSSQVILGDYIHSSGQDYRHLDILHWLSTIPHRKHHLNMIKDILPGSGQWLTLHDTYRSWQCSDVSSILWLHGIPGCGKSKLVAHVVQTFLDRQKSSDLSSPLAFFYCARTAAEQKRSDPNEIIRSILRQFSGTGSVNNPVNPAIVDQYTLRKNEAETAGSDIDVLTIAECVTLLHDIASETSITIVIDALDECDPSTRYQLINALQEIAQQSANLVKIFISSREDGDIVMRMKGIPNVLIGASENSKDIQQFIDVKIDEAVKERRLLKGLVDDELRGQIKTSLLQGANGMFQWVNLVIQNLCDFQRLQLAEDVPAEITRLPSGLADLYRIALLQIYDKGPKAKNAATNALRWLLYARLPLSTPEFTAVVAKDTRTELSPDDILILCNNLVVIDMELNVFRFAHLSVREYLESQAEFWPTIAEPTIAIQCLNICTDFIQRLEQSPIVIADQITHAQYASLYWLVHCSVVSSSIPSPLLEALQAFLGIKENTGNVFEKWMTTASKFPTRFATADWRLRIKMSFSLSPHPIFLAIAFELMDLVSIIVSNHKLEEDLLNQFQLSPLAVACNIGNLEIAKILVEDGAEVNIEDKVQSWRAKDGDMPPNPLTAAVYHRHWDIMRFLLAAGADPNPRCSSGYYHPPLTAAVRCGLNWVVEELIEAGADVNISSGRSTPIQAAAFNGETLICRTLLDHKADPTLVGSRNTWNDPTGSLELAASEGHFDVVRMVVEAGVPLDNCRSGFGTALAQAAWHRHCNVVKYLLCHGADPNINCEPYGTPFLSAVAGGDMEIITTFLQHGANINHKGTDEGNALVIAAHYSHEEAFAFLLNQGVDTEDEVSQHNSSCSIQHLIVFYASLSALRALVRSYDSLNRGKKLGQLLFSAVEANQYKDYRSKIEWLIEIGADPNWQNEDGTRPIHAAVKRLAFSIVQLLLERGARIDVVCSVYGSPLQALYLHAADRLFLLEDDLESIETDIFDILVSYGVDLNARGGILGTALQAASYFGRCKHVERLIDLGATVVEQDGYFGSPFNAAVSMGHVSVVRLFLRMGVNVHAACGPYGTALQAAACLGRRPASLLLEPFLDCGPSLLDPRDPLSYGNYFSLRDITSYRQIFELLLESNVDVHMGGGIYGSAVQAAAYSGQLDMLKHLLENGADVHRKSGFYGSCLQAACCAESRWWWNSWWSSPDSEDSVIFSEDEPAPPEPEDHLGIVELLLDKEVDVNYRGGYFGTALQAAIHSDKPDVVKLLLNAGACVTEDGCGFYGGCFSAAISCGKQILMGWRRTDLRKTNAEEILDMLLHNTTSQDLPAMLTSVIARAHEKSNDEGLALLKVAISNHSAHRGLVDELFL